MGKDLKGKELGEGLCQQKDGRYLGRYTDRYGKRHSIYAHKLKDLKEKLTKAKYEDSLGVESYDTRLTFDDVFNKWFEMKLKTVRENTCRGYRAIYNKNIKQYIGDLKIISIKTQDIEDVFANYKGKSYLAIKKVLAGVYTYSIKNRFVVENIYKLSNLPKESQPKLKAILNEREQQIFTEYCLNKTKVSKYKHYDLFVILLYTGLRIGEAIALSWSDIDFSKKIIKINKTVSTDLNYKLTVNSPKTENSKRIVPMCDLVYNVLSLKKQKYNNKENGIVFYGDNNYKHIRNFERILQNIVRNIQTSYPQFPNITPHSLRHTFTTRCFEKGVSPKIVQKYLGHSKLSITMDLYTHIDEKLLIENINKINL